MSMMTMMMIIMMMMMMHDSISDEACMICTVLDILSVNLLTLAFPFRGYVSRVCLPSCCSPQGLELQKMFKEHGSFEGVEVAVRKRSVREQNNSKAGGWYTRTYLETKEGFTKSRP